MACRLQPGTRLAVESPAESCMVLMSHAVESPAGPLPPLLDRRRLRNALPAACRGTRRAGLVHLAGLVHMAEPGPAAAATALAPAPLPPSSKHGTTPSSLGGQPEPNGCTPCCSFFFFFGDREGRHPSLGAAYS